MAERVYCLYRVSTNKQVDHDENNQADIPMQRKACHDFAAKMGWCVGLSCTLLKVFGPHQSAKSECSQACVLHQRRL